MTDLGHVLDLERAVWSALVAGDAAADARLLSEDFLGVYGSGFAGREDHAGQLRDGPTVSSYDLSGVRMLALAEDVVLLSYLAFWVPWAPGEPARPRTMYVTSIWRRDGDAWTNVFSQDTPAED